MPLPSARRRPPPLAEKSLTLPEKAHSQVVIKNTFFEVPGTPDAYSSAGLLTAPASLNKIGVIQGSLTHAAQMSDVKIVPATPSTIYDSPMTPNTISGSSMFSPLGTPALATPVSSHGLAPMTPSSPVAMMTSIYEGRPNFFPAPRAMMQASSPTPSQNAASLAGFLATGTSQTTPMSNSTVDAAGRKMPATRWADICVETDVASPLAQTAPQRKFEQAVSPQQAVPTAGVQSPVDQYIIRIPMPPPMEPPKLPPNFMAQSPGPSPPPMQTGSPIFQLLANAQPPKFAPPAGPAPGPPPPPQQSPQRIAAQVSTTYSPTSTVPRPR